MKSARRPFFVLLVAVVVTVPAALVFAQNDPSPAPAPPPVPGIDPALIAQLVAAWNARAYPLVGAIVVGAILAVAKNGWLSSTVASWLPPRARPWIAPLVGILTVTTTSIKAGVSWPIAILYGAFSGAAAIAGHDMVVEGLLKGQEIIPKAPWHNPNASGGSQSGAGSAPKAGSDQFKAPPPPTSVRMLAPLVACVGLGAVPVATVGGLAATETGCTPAEQAMFVKVENLVLADLEAGKSLAQVEQDVGQLVAGQPGADVAILVADALTFLVDIGAIPANILPTAKAMLAVEAPIAAQHRAAKAAAAGGGGS